MDVQFTRSTFHTVHVLLNKQGMIANTGDSFKYAITIMQSTVSDRYISGCYSVD